MSHAGHDEIVQAVELLSAMTNQDCACAEQKALREK